MSLSVEDLKADLDHWFSTLSGHGFYLGQNYHCPAHERLQGSLLLGDEQAFVQRLITDIPYLSDLRGAIQVIRSTRGVDREVFAIRIGELEFEGQIQ